MIKTMTRDGISPTSSTPTVQNKMIANEPANTDDLPDAQSTYFNH